MIKEVFGTHFGHFLVHMSYIFKRGKWFHYRRRVPRSFESFYDSQFVKISLKTDSEAIAVQRAAIFNAELERIWADAVLDNGSGALEKISQAVEIARLHGFSYLTADQIAQKDNAEIIRRVETLPEAELEDESKVSALLGAYDHNALSITAALEHFFEFQLPNLSNKSENQIRKWKNPRIKAVGNFVSVIGDLPVDQINRDHILTLRAWWFDRVQEEGLSPDSPNKDFTHLRSLLSFIRDDKKIDLNIEHMFSRIRFASVVSSRPPFPTSFIENELLDLGKLAGLHKECQLFLFAMADTGARPSELLGLDASSSDIRLDCTIPYIHIRPKDKRALKTVQSERQIPLVGSALYAFKNLPEGFEHYFGKADQLSANINKYLRDHGLLPTDDHSIYSLRHSFEDRLTAVEPPEKVQAALMGHKYHRPRYGKGPSLEQKKEWLNKICFHID